MWGRLLGLLAGLALCGEAVVLWRPQAIGALQSPDLGPFTSYRLIIAALAGVVGVAVIVAALLREPAKSKPIKPTGADAGGAGDAPFQAVPVFHMTTAEPDPAPAGQAADQGQDVRLAHEAEALAPFPVDDAPAASEASEGPSCPVPASMAAAGERGTFLAAIDAADHMRAANRMDDALELYDGALALARRAHAAAPADPTAQRDLALALTSVADIHDREGRLESALDLHEESLGLRRGLAGQSPGDLAAQRALSTGLERLADTREARGHRSRARDLFRERLPLAERLSASAPGDSSLAQDLSTTRDRLTELNAALEP